MESRDWILLQTSPTSFLNFLSFSSFYPRAWGKYFCPSLWLWLLWAVHMQTSVRSEFCVNYSNSIRRDRSGHARQRGLCLWHREIWWLSVRSERPLGWAQHGQNSSLSQAVAEGHLSWKQLSPTRNILSGVCLSSSEAIHHSPASAVTGPSSSDDQLPQYSWQKWKGKMFSFSVL